MKNKRHNQLLGLSTLVFSLCGWSTSGWSQTVRPGAVTSLPAIAQAAPTPELNRPTLKPGSQGTEVGELQAALKLLGYYAGNIDSVYGESTAIAVTKFQEEAGLKSDGIVGADTWNRLFPTATPTPTPTATPTITAPPLTPTASASPAPSTTSATAAATPPTSTTAAAPRPVTPPTTVDLPTLRLGMRGPAITRLQERLRSLGFFKGVIDGVFGAETQAAVQAAQRSYRLDPDGIVGASTWTAIMR